MQYAKIAKRPLIFNAGYRDGVKFSNAIRKQQKNYTADQSYMLGKKTEVVLCKELYAM